MEYLFRYEYISESADRGGAIVMNWQIASEAEQEEEEEVNSGSSVKSFDRWHRYHHRHCPHGQSIFKRTNTGLYLFTYFVLFSLQFKYNLKKVQVD